MTSDREAFSSKENGPDPIEGSDPEFSKNSGTLTVDVAIEDERWMRVDIEALAEAAARATLRHQGLDPEQWEISLLACDDARIAALNTDFRGKAQPTNVLSWPSQERASATPGTRPAPPRPCGDPSLGDIAIAWDTCQAEAARDAKPLSDHATHLIVHGILHLLGYDHERDTDATLMERYEVEILGKLGLSDPY